MTGKARVPAILIAEDDDDDYEHLVRVLNGSGLAAGLRRVKDGLAALEVLRDGSTLPTLVILDLNMPRIDGRAALDEIRKDPALKHLPVVVLSGSQAAEDLERAFLPGADYFLRKPLELARFLMILGALDSADASSP